MQMNAAANLLDLVTYAAEHGEPTHENWLRLQLCESCKGDLFDVAADYLCECGLIRATVVKLCDGFAPALTLS